MPTAQDGSQRRRTHRSDELGLDDAPDAYNHFDNRDDGWTKVVLKPQMAAAA